MESRFSKIQSLDVYRDGGSVSVTLLTDEVDKIYILMFPIKESPDDPRLKWRTYRDPIWEIYVKGTYTSPVTGISSPEFSKENHPSSWPEARAVLKAIEEFMPNLKSDFVEIYEYMVEVATSNGAYAGS